VTKVQELVVVVVTKKISKQNKINSTKGDKSLSLLLSAAATLLGTQQVTAAPVEEVDSSLKYHLYQESDNRMKVDTALLWVVAPVGENTQIQISASREIMSGASPQFVTNRSGTPVQVLSSASIYDERNTGEINVKHFFDDFNVSVSGYTSIEDDYKSQGLSITLEKEFYNKNTVISLGFGDSSDTIKPTETTIHERRFSNDVLVSWTQILNQTSLFQLVVSYSQGAGYFSDPYKFSEVFTEDNLVPILVPDHRPDQRKTQSLSFKYRKHFIGSENSLNVDYSFFS